LAAAVCFSRQLTSFTLERKRRNQNQAGKDGNIAVKADSESEDDFS